MVRSVWVAGATCVAAGMLAVFTAITTSPKRTEPAAAALLQSPGLPALGPLPQGPQRQERGSTSGIAAETAPAAPQPAPISEDQAGSRSLLRQLDAQEREREDRLYLPQAVVAAAGWLTWSGHRISQSVRWHLQQWPEATQLPAARRPELAALSRAAPSLSTSAVAAELSALLPPAAMTQARKDLAAARTHAFAAQLAATASLDLQQLATAHEEIGALDGWRVDVIARIAATTGQEAYELEIARRALAYVVQSVGYPLRPGQDAAARAAAVALAHARVHHATRSLDSSALYRLALELGVESVGKVFAALEQAATRRMDDHLLVFAAGMAGQR